MLKRLVLGAAMLAISGAQADDEVLLDLDGALALKERLEDDVLLLNRIRDVQESLLAFNAIRRLRGLPPVTVPGELCIASPLKPLCPDLPATFARIRP